jgi:hypothetical protein
MEIQAKDYQRLQDIKSQPGKEIGLASKQAKLIKDPDKAVRRWLASVSVFGSDHAVTQIFNNRQWELRGGIVTVVENKIIAVETKTLEPETIEIVNEIVNRIERTQDDFPIGCQVKMGDKVGKVIDHGFLNKETVKVEFDGAEETINIYDIKRC